MSTVRQDAWSEDDDYILAEVTLRHIREGSTQLSAFEEVGDQIGRTAAACGFRWNSFVRKKYEAAIQIAKSQRQKRMQLKKKPIVHYHVNAMNTFESLTYPEIKQEQCQDENITFDGVIRFLRHWKQNSAELTRQIKYYEKELSLKQEEMDRLKRTNEKLSHQVNEVSTDYQVVNDDYKALIQIMDRARKMAFLKEQDEEMKPRFKMEENGNLERIDL
jgi:prespore-specific regulator